VNATLPDGTYRGESRIQYRANQWADIVVSVEISGTDIAFDFTGTSPQTDSYVNAPLPVTQMGVLQCIAMMLASDIDRDAVLNAGFTEAIEIRVPPRGILAGFGRGRAMAWGTRHLCRGRAAR